MIGSGFLVEVRNESSKARKMLGNDRIFIPAKFRKDFCDISIAEMLKDLTD